MMKFSNFSSRKVRFVFTDIDDTLTDSGQLGAQAYSALWQLHDAGFVVIPVTGRPAGWCEMIARLWPVGAVVGENGGLYFRYHNKKMLRFFAASTEVRRRSRVKLDRIGRQVLKKIRGSRIASDQFCRLFDLAIDICEDVKPLGLARAEMIRDIFVAHGAQAKISSIHVNGWFGKFNKLSTCLRLLKREWNVDLRTDNSSALFIGDSPNDEPMFEFFENSVAVANIEEFQSLLKHPPRFVCEGRGGTGFSEMAKRLLELKR